MNRYNAALLMLVLGGCGPTAREAGGGVVVAAPVVLLLSGALLWAIIALHRRREAEVSFAWRPLLTTALASLGFALLFLVFDGRRSDWELGLFAIWVYGTSVLALALVVWRVWHALQPRTAMPAALIGSWAVLTLPALPLLLDDAQGGGLFAAALTVWIYAGYAGIVTGPLWLVLFLEALVRLTLRRRQVDRLTRAETGPSVPR